MAPDFDDREAALSEDLEDGSIDQEEYDRASADLEDERNAYENEAAVNAEIEELREESDADDFEVDDG